jgi:putative Holliday junction resolvase
VVGLPLTAGGGEGEASGAARELAANLARRTGLPVELWDERMTTARVLGIDRETGGGPRDRARLDARAAAIMLQGWLEARRHGGGTGRRPGAPDG